MAELTARGFTPGKQGNDPDHSFLPDDVAVIRHGPDADLAAAQVARHIKGAVLAEVPRDNMVIDVVLGNKFEQVTPLAEMPPRPRRAQGPAAHRLAPLRLTAPERDVHGSGSP